MANMKDLAKAAGVSLATISRVFNESDKVKPATQKRILALAEKMNYRPNKMAAALRKGKSGSIAIVVPFIHQEVFSFAIKSMEEILRGAGYNVLICQSFESFEQEKEIIENLKHLKIDGIIISISKETKRIHHLSALQKENIPIIFFDRMIEIGAVNSVVINNYNGAYQATNHLIEQGCKNIIHLVGRKGVTIFNERRRGFEAAVTDNQKSLKTTTVITFDDGQPEGIKQLKTFLQSVNPPIGILAHGDIAALVALRIINELKLHIPEEVAIIGFGDSNFCTYLRPSLSSVNQRNEDVGKLAATLLINAMNQDGDLGVISQQMLPPILKIRGSSKRKI